MRRPTMSDAKDRLDAAIAEYAATLADADGPALLLDYVLVIASATEADFVERQTAYTLEAPDGQLFHHGLGLIERARLLLQERSSE
jgi:hypothetical protein